MKSEEAKLFRLIDANLNRLREGVRVVEDILRYIDDNADLAKRLKEVRHMARFEDPRLLECRDIEGDVLKRSTSSEMARTDITSLKRANIKRAQESARVLEEALKLVDTDASETFKKIRYELYNIEKAL